MPKLPDDPAAAHAAAERQKQRRAEAALREQRATEHDEQILRAFANELRAQQGMPPLKANEPILAFRCRRGHKPEHH